MAMFRSLGLSAKIGLLLVGFGLLALGTALFGARTVAEANGGYDWLVHHGLPPSTDLARANRRAIEMVYVGYKRAAGAATPADAVKDLDKAHERGAKNLAEAAEADPALADRVAALARDYEAVHAAVARALRLADGGQADAARAELAAADKRLKTFAETLSDMIYARVEQTDAEAKRVAGLSAGRARGALIGVLAMLAVALGLAFLFVRRDISGPLARLRGAIDGLAAGNDAASAEIADDGRQDEIGAMARALVAFRTARAEQARLAAARDAAERDQQAVVALLSDHLGHVADGRLDRPIDQPLPPGYEALRQRYNGALAGLNAALGGAASGAQAIRIGAREISEAADDLARRAERTAAAIEQTGAAAADIDSRIKATARTATESVSSAEQAMASVEHGRSSAGAAIGAMDRVSNSAQGIDSVIEGLDKIAFQTRVLAMNAAVEAGRAGEAGRGFAVVADLVSTLAMRSEEEAKRAREQLSSTRSDIDSAAAAVSGLDEALAQIAERVGRVADLLATIAEQNRSQAESISRISGSLGEMDVATQQNAAMVEQTSAAVRGLNQELEGLVEAVGAFSLMTAGGRAGAGRAAGAARIAVAA
ncbi:methyl-accepting chemotaxis protein [Sphingomonas changnyeongensis]|uniref:Methyl-accepting chemotaxis protein n=1 Tax=Sphingomonas changnyeongensis TaxID=2698679 RepID=A0A7Z2NVN5_9SPHN|nr:methyl-accepting chemotaxis protein [Sphingomonas changnyeongensis]QHL90577.1 methyl-accepting chemotaxis protein [Sphingomonas changnyeongensis]